MIIYLLQSWYGGHPVVKSQALTCTVIHLTIYKSSPCKFRSSVIDRDFTNLNLIEAWVQYALPGYNLCHGTSAAEAKRMNEFLFPYFIYLYIYYLFLLQRPNEFEVFRKFYENETKNIHPLDKKKFTTKRSSPVRAVF